MPPPTRPRGAQPGNRNALKHGRYATVALPPPPQDPAALNLENEIIALRAVLRRAIAAPHQPADLNEAIHYLRTVTLHAAVLNRLVKTQFWLSGCRHKDIASIMQTLSEIAKELDLDEPSP